jgi:hypothetical protein
MSFIRLENTISQIFVNIWIIGTWSSWLEDLVIAHISKPTRDYFEIVGVVQISFVIGVVVSIDFIFKILYKQYNDNTNNRMVYIADHNSQLEEPIIQSTQCSELHFCPICLRDDIAQKQMSKIYKCAHMLCKDCRYQMERTQINKIVQITPPTDNHIMIHGNLVCPICRGKY